MIYHHTESTNILKTCYAMNTLMTLKKIKLNQDLCLFIFLFHLNTYFLLKNFDDLEYLVKTTTQTLDVTAITRIKSNMYITTYINMLNYPIESTPTECHVEVTFLYINKTIAYKPRKDLDI